MNGLINWIDLLAALVLLLFAAGGWRRGLVLELLDLAVLVVSLASAFLLFPYVGGFFGSTPLANVLSFVIIFFVVSSLVGALARRALRPVPAGVHRSRPNRALGAVLGAAKGALLAGFLVMALSSLPGPISSEVDGSYAGKIVLEHGMALQTKIASMVPDDVIQGLGFITVRPGAEESLDIPKRSKTAAEPGAEQQMLEMVNQERTSRGLRPLREDDQIRSVARAHSQDMFNRGFFAHMNPDGDDPFDRMRAGGVRFLTAGENIAMAPTVRMAHEGLMNSPGHRANILEGAFRRVGIGVQVSGGQMMFTQNFAN